MISINICRITPDRKYIEFNVETLSNYKFKHLYVWQYNQNDIWVVSNSTIDLGSNFDRINNKEIKRLLLEDLNLNGSSLFYLQFVVEWDGTGSENPNAVLSASTSIADLSQNYFTKVKLVSNLEKDTLSLDKLLALQFYESCFKATISLERWEDANSFYDKMKKLISNNIIVSL